MTYATAELERQLWEGGHSLVCGVDEVGRGCFAGPVVVGAVIFPMGFSQFSGIADSKLLTAKKRKELALRIKELALYWAIDEVSVEVINRVGIGKATQIAFFQVVRKLEQFPQHILIDAFYIDAFNKRMQSPVIGGDKLSVSIAAASIIAKVYRDELMEKLGVDFPDYLFEDNKGYGTKAHREAIKKNGLSPLHRTSFNLNKFL
jgi:ribonuclease HII